MTSIKTIFLSTVLLLCGYSAQAQEGGWTGTWGAYEMSLGDTLGGLAPEGYEPIYVLQVNRDGSGISLREPAEAILQSLSQQPLTKRGQQLRKAVEKVASKKALHRSLDTYQNHLYETLGARFQATYAAMLGNASVRLHTQSATDNGLAADAFQAGLRKSSIRVERNVEPWQATLTDEEQQLLSFNPQPWYDGQQWAQAFFVLPLDAKESFNLMCQVARLHVLLQNMGEGNRLASFIGENELRAAFDWDDERLWTLAGQSPDTYGYPLESATQTLDNLLNYGLRAIQEGAKADVFYTSLEGLHRLISIVGFNNLSDEHVNRLSNFLPLGANLRIVFYAKGKQVVAKLMMNERDKRQFGLPNEMPPYEQWNRVLAYLKKRQTRFEMQRALRNLGDGRVFEPNPMIVWTPQRHAGQLQGIQAAHPTEDGGDYGSFTLMPLLDTLVLDRQQWGLNLGTEDQHPDFYTAQLPDVQAQLSLTGMSHTGFVRLERQEAGRTYLVLAPDAMGATMKVDTARQMIYGKLPVARSQYADTIQSYIVLVPNHPMDACGVQDGVAWAAFDMMDKDELMVKMAGSFVSLAGALNNIEQEIPHWEFYDTRMRNVTAWERRLKAIRDTTLFARYYDAAILPRAVTDRDGRYPMFGKTGQIAQKSLGNLGGKPLTERVYADIPLRHRADIMDLYEQANVPLTPFLKSILYAWQESGCMDESTIQYLKKVLKEGMPNIDLKQFQEAIRQSEQQR